MSNTECNEKYLSYICDELEKIKSTNAKGLDDLGTKIQSLSSKIEDITAVLRTINTTLSK